jgi:hypothetical protein
VRYFELISCLFATSDDVFAEYGVRSAEVVLHLANQSVAELRRPQLLLLKLSHE